MSERSFFVLEGLRRGISSPFEKFEDGLDLLSPSSDQEALEDALRHWSELCDRMDGARIVFDGWNGFGGVAEKVSLYLEEEHSKVKKTFFFFFFFLFEQKEARQILSVFLSIDFQAPTIQLQSVLRE